MKKVMIVVGAVLLAAAVILLGIGLLFRGAALTVMDGTANLIARLFAASRVFLLLGAGAAVPGIALLVTGIVIRIR